MVHLQCHWKFSAALPVVLIPNHHYWILFHLTHKTHSLTMHTSMITAAMGWKGLVRTGPESISARPLVPSSSVCSRSLFVAGKNENYFWKGAEPFLLMSWHLLRAAFHEDMLITGCYVSIKRSQKEILRGRTLTEWSGLSPYIWVRRERNKWARIVHGSERARKNAGNQPEVKIKQNNRSGKASDKHRVVLEFNLC